MSFVAPNDRRIGERLRIKGCYVRAQAGGLFKALFRQGVPRRLPLVNISMSGMQFLLNEPLGRDHTVTMDVTVEWLSEPFRVKGKVVWSRKLENKNIWTIGVAFSKLSRSARIRLEKIQRDGLLHAQDEDLEYS